MPRTIGYHWVKSAYGLWLPGDERGHWSSVWDEQIGYIEPHMLHEGDPVRQRMATERMRHRPVRLDQHMIDAATRALRGGEARSDWQFAALTMQPTHMHALITYNTRDIDKTVKWLADQMTKTVHACTPHIGPVWCKGRWLQFVFDSSHWDNLIAYIGRHDE